MKYGYWDVDTQRDFMEENGALSVKGAGEIVANLERLYERARAGGIPVVASADAHGTRDPELEQYPPHCMKGTPGAERIPATRMDGELRIPTDLARAPDVAGALREGRQVVIEKQTIDAFSNPHADTVVRESGVGHWIVFGVCTDICVQVAVLGLLERNCEVTVVTDAVRGLDEKESRKWLERMTEKGAKLRTTDEVLQSLSCEKGTAQ